MTTTDEGLVEVRYSANQIVTARHVLFAGLPPAVLLGVTFVPPLPQNTDQLFQRMPLGKCDRARD